MAQTVMELVAKITPQGASDTQAALDETQETFEETADVAGEQAATFEGFADKWQGAMQAIVVGLGVAATGLLTQVPIVGEAMSGLESIITALALKMDETLRPAMNNVTSGLFDVANRINSADGAAGTLIGTLTTLATVAFIAGAAFELLARSIIVTQLVSYAKAALSAAGATTIFGASLSSLAVAAGIIAGIVALGAAIGLLGAELLGITNVTPVAATQINSLMGLIANLAFLIGGPFVAIIGAALMAIQGDFQGAKNFVVAMLDEWLKAAQRFWIRVRTGFATLGAAVRGIMETAWDAIVKLSQDAMNFLAKKVESFINGLINQFNQISSKVGGPTLQTVDLPRFQTQGFGQIAQQNRQEFQQRLAGFRRQGQAELAGLQPTPATGGGQDRKLLEKLEQLRREQEQTKEATQDAAGQQTKIEFSQPELRRLIKQVSSEGSQTRGRIG